MIHYETSLWDLKPVLDKRIDKNEKNYETSLWDLKPSNHSSIPNNDSLWDIPMGFETIYFFVLGSPNYIMRHPYGIWNSVELSSEKIGTLWDIPMGFET